MNLYVVRHGQTDWNINGLVQGLTDIELNSTGIDQANQVAEQLKDVNFASIYASPLKRTIETSKIINKYHNIDITLDKRIIERCFGIFEGTNGLKNKYDYWDYQLNLDDNNVESLNVLFERIKNFLSEIYELYKNTDSNILIVTHGGTAIAINAVINNITSDLFSLCLKNCEIKIFKNIKLD